jgi:hypothetical protein
MKKSARAHQLAHLFVNAPQVLSGARTVVGLDGFVDAILHVVDQRESARSYTRIERMADYAHRIERAAGLSANFEFVQQMLKLGGNGPILANALHALGTPVTYIGNLGAPQVHPVFASFAATVDVISIAEPGYTDAIEFTDGKLMCGKLTSLAEVNWTTLLRYVPEERLLRIFSDATLIALVNWTMLPHMSAIFRKLLTRIAPKLSGPKRWLFFDLADPAKRTREDLVEALKLIGRFERYFRVILGLNLQESRQVGEVLGFRLPHPTHDTVAEHAARIRERMEIDTVVVHPTQFAAAADAEHAVAAAGPFLRHPKITTGAGDHFNAGFCIGRLLGGDLHTSLRMGVGTSGFYVRRARSPRLEELRRFLQQF